MANTLRFKRGLVAGIPTALAGEPLFTTDTFDLYIGNGTTNTRFQKYIASGTTLQYLRGDGSLATFPTNIITGTGVSGQVAYWSGASTQVGSNNLFWDATNSRLGIGTNVPTAPLDIISNSGSSAITIRGRTSDNRSNLRFYSNDNATQYATFDVLPSVFRFNVIQNIPLAFYTNNTEHMRLTANGLLLLGTTTEGTQRLQVTGDTLLKGSGNTSATTALTVQDSGGNNLITVRNDNVINIGLRPGVSIYPAAFGAVPNITGRGIAMSFIASDTAYEPLTLTHGNFTTTANGYIVLNTIGTFNPTSGTATYTANRIGSTINQTGGANGITRGLYVNPTLTAAADWRSIETSNNSGWAFYGAGSANSYFGGSVGIGTTTLANANLRISKTITGGTTAYAQLIEGAIQSDVTTAVYSASLASTQATTFTLTNLFHFLSSQGTFGAGSTVTNQFGFRVQNNFTGATNNYGFFGDIASGTGRWNLYMNGTANNYMAGSLGIGTTTIGTSNLRIFKTLTGGTTVFSINNDATIASDVTTNAHYNRTSATTTAAAFTLTNLSHYYANQGTFGAGSIVTNQYGFLAELNLTGATNNYGFFGNIAAATNRWNFYAAGSASNYFNGNTIMGTLAADSGEKLQVNGTMKVTGASTFNTSVNVASGSATTGYFITAAGTTAVTRLQRGTAVTFLTDNYNAFSPTTQDDATRASWFIPFGGGSGADYFRIQRSPAGSTTMTTLLNIASTGAATFSSTITAGGNLGAANQRVANFRNSGGNGYIELQSSGAGAVALWTASGNEFAIYQNATAGTIGTNVFHITSAANVGISTFTPAYKLDVNGTFGATGAATFSSSVTVSTNLVLNGTSIEQNNASGLTLNASNVSGAILFRTAGAERLSISNTGAANFSSSIQAATAIAIGTTPDTNKPFKILKNINGTVGINFENTSTSSLAFSAIQMGTDVTGGTKFTNLVYASSGVTASGVYNPDGTSLINNGGGGLNFLGTPTRFYTGGGNGVLRLLHDNEGTTQFTATTPTTNATDGYKQYSADVVAGNAAPHFRTENGAVIKLYQETTGVGNAIFSQGGGNAVLDDSTFAGYTLRQIVQALRNQGILA